MNFERPKILQEIGLGRMVNEQKLRELQLPVQEIAMEELLWQFGIPFWEKDGTHDWNLTLWDVINSVEGSAGHRKRVEGVDLSCPIYVMRNNQGHFVVLDGTHRLVKAYLQGQHKIKAYVVPQEEVLWL